MLKTVKVSTSDLDIGMYVSGLDRPWLDTPFVTQGFFIETKEEIAKLQKYCDYVYVDRRRSLRPGYTQRQVIEKREPTARAAVAASGQQARKIKDRPRIPMEKIFGGRRLRSYRDDSSFEDEQPRALRALSTLIVDIDHMFEEVEDGEKLDVIKLRQSVDPIVDSIGRNPDACIWVTRLKQHDRYTYQHSLSASIWAVSLGRQIGLPRHDLRSLAMGCMLMDIGKLRIDATLLKVDRNLNTEEIAELATHVQHGLDILQECGVINQDVVDMVAHHHERHDGSGYPNGLAHNEIPPFARIAGIVDTYDAITSHRSYAPALSPTDAIKVLYESRDREFQAELVEAFIQAIGIYPAGTLVELSNGEVGVVVAEYRTRRLRPKVMLLLDASKRQVRERRIIDLQAESANDGSPLLSIRKSLEPDAYGIDLSGIPYQEVS